MKKTTTFVASLLFLSAATVVYAEVDAAAGKAKAATCAGCHGVSGVSNNDLWPNLAGQKNGYLIKQMKDFRDGKRDDPMMKGMTATLSDQDIENLAAYFSGL